MRKLSILICLALVVLPLCSLAQIREEPPGTVQTPHPPQQDPGWRLGHTRKIATIDFSPDGRLIATCADDNSIRLWRASTGALLWTVNTHESTPIYAAFTPGGRELLVSFDKGDVGLFGVEAGTMRTRRSKMKWDVSGLAWLPDGKHFAVASPGGKIDIIDKNLPVGARVTHGKVRYSDMRHCKKRKRGYLHAEHKRQQGSQFSCDRLSDRQTGTRLVRFDQW